MTEIAFAYPYLTRTQTAPVNVNTMMSDSGGGRGAGSHFSTGGSKMNMNSNHAGHNSLVHSQGHTSSNYSIQSQPSSRSSDTTQGTAHSTLFPPPPGAPPMPNNAGAVAGMQNGGDVTATDNVMNTVADANSSLFQICVNLRLRLTGVQGFSESIEEEELNSDEDTDPVTLLWRTFRRGYPLMLLYNALRPNQPLAISQTMREDKRGKAATFKFIQACLQDLNFPQEKMFIITDLYKDDTAGFVKVARVVNRVLDVLVQRGMIEDVRPTASDFEQADKSLKKSQRQHIVSELVTTERTYVQHLELLQSFKHLVEEKGVIPGDAIHDIFLNLNSLLDFQRRFLIRVEQTNALPEEEQNWGKLFVLYCEAFKVYEPYIANQKKCEKTVVSYFPQLAAGITTGASVEIRQMVESPTSLYGFLMKPFQRLSKYPLLLDDLHKKGDLDPQRKDDLVVGKEAASGVLARTNKAVDREEKAEAVQELKTRVEDWKGHSVVGFGELLLYGTFTVLKSENMGVGKEGERQYHVYLFETILLCCKDIDLSKPKNKLSNKQLVDKRGKPKLQLKGRIFMQNVTDLVSLAKPGSYTCQIFWKGDPSIENFIIRFTTEEAMKKWAGAIEVQRRKYRPDRESDSMLRNGGASRPPGLPAGTSVTEFEFMRGMAPMENPYARMTEEEEDDDEEDDVETLVASQNLQGGGGYPYKSDFEQSRNGSSTSLRSRSTTGESGIQNTNIAGGRAAPPPSRMQPGSTQQQQQQQPPNLALRTRELQATGHHSPYELAGHESYFSPVDGSPSAHPSSARTSTSSGMYSFSRQPAMNGYYEEGHGHLAGTRFTAPAPARPREPSVGYPPPPQSLHASQQGAPVGRTRPGLGMGMHSAQQLPGQPRNRSASSPDIQNNNPLPPSTMRGPPISGAVPQPPVPEMPAGYYNYHQQQNLQQQHMMVPRSQNGSPNLALALPPPMRGMSPQMLRERNYASQQQQQQQQQPQMQQMNRGLFPGGAGGGGGQRTMTPVINRSDTFTPPTPTPTQTQSQSPPSRASTNANNVIDQQPPNPTQLKVKVHLPAASQTLTLVVPPNITCQSLKDRIDAKLQRSTNLSLADSERAAGAGGVGGVSGGKSLVKLKYSDEGDFVSIQSDEDVLTAFEAWREQSGGGQEGVGGAGAGVGAAMGEVELWCK